MRDRERVVERICQKDLISRCQEVRSELVRLEGERGKRVRSASHSVVAMINWINTQI